MYILNIYTQYTIFGKFLDQTTHKSLPKESSAVAFHKYATFMPQLLSFTTTELDLVTNFVEIKILI